MRNWTSNNKTLNAQSQKVNRTYSLDKNISERFRQICESEGRTQSKQLNIMMQRYADARV